MDLELHSLAWPDSNPAMLRAHQRVMGKFGLSVSYWREQVAHGAWMDRVLTGSQAEIVGFLDNDCIPTNAEVVPWAASYVEKHRTLLGTAQVSNHIPPKCHVFAAPAFFFISRQAWLDMGSPTCSETPNSDVAENVSHQAEAQGRPYKVLYPTHWTREPIEGAWRLGNFGLFGVGTHYDGGVFHLYQGRYDQNADLFVQTCQAVIEDRYTTEGMISAVDDYEGRIFGS